MRVQNVQRTVFLYGGAHKWLQRIRRINRNTKRSLPDILDSPDFGHWTLINNFFLRLEQHRLELRRRRRTALLLAILDSNPA
jgi:hypothetical protein